MSTFVDRLLAIHTKGAISYCRGGDVTEGGGTWPHNDTCRALLAEWDEDIRRQRREDAAAFRRFADWRDDGVRS